MTEYIQLKTGIAGVIVTAVAEDSTLRIHSEKSDDVAATTYLDARGALLLAGALLAAAKHIDPLDEVEILPRKASGLLGAL